MGHFCKKCSGDFFLNPVFLTQEGSLIDPKKNLEVYYFIDRAVERA
jgi:hypothetical protein